jgi:diguanylate cyclase (GGDEF)-like protein
MAAKRRKTIGGKIVAVVFASVLLAVASATIMSLWMQATHQIANRKASIEGVGIVLASAIGDHMDHRYAESMREVLRSIARLPDVKYAAVAMPDGKIIAALGSAAFLVRDLNASDATTLALLRAGAMPVAVDVINSGTKVGKIIVIADLSSLRASLFNALLWTLAAALAATILGIAVALRLQRRITRPIMSLTEAMRHIRSERDYSTKVEHMSDDETGLLVDSFNAMMTEINLRDDQLGKLAYFDPLTGIGNRRRFHEDIRQLSGEGQPAAVVLVDLDNFKQVNDTFGHTTGDALLMEVAALLQQEAPAGAKLTRLGGDEFAVVLPGLNDEFKAETALARLAAKLSHPVSIMNREIAASACFGACLTPRDGVNSSELLRKADLALHRAKKRGKGSIQFFRAAMDSELIENTELARNLREAISSDGLHLHFQPQVDLITGRVAGFESLARWLHPERGEISPGRFIPIAEQSGLICDLGLWVLRASFREAKRWLIAGHPRRQVAVNVSAVQLQQSDFLSAVEQVLLETELPAQLLCLELTESVFAECSSGEVQRILETLQGLGVNLALDDFGTGYSSLSYLQNLPFLKVKIDRAFVSGIEHDGQKREMLAGIVKLIHALDMLAVAEGAETDSEVRILMELGIDQVQGFALGRPVASNQAMEQAKRLDEEFRQKFAAAAELQKSVA